MAGNGKNIWAVLVGSILIRNFRKWITFDEDEMDVDDEEIIIIEIEEDFRDRVEPQPEE